MVTKGTVKFKGSTEFKEGLIKYDKLNDELTFKGKDNEALAFANQVEESTIIYSQDHIVTTRRYKNGYKNIPEAIESSFFLIIADGGIKILIK